MENNISYEDDKKQSSYCFKSNKFKLDEISDLDDSDKSIIDFDDEYSEASNLYSIKCQKNRKIEKYDDHSDSRIYNHSKEKQIIYHNLKQLMDIDINNKKGIIDLLMKDNLIQKKSIETKEKNNNKFYYVKAKSKNQKMGKEKNTYGRTGFQIEAREGDPEFIKDINIAAGILKNRIQEKDENVAKILFDELYTEQNSKKIITRKEIGDKVNKTLEKRRKNLEKIEAKIYGEQKIEETFTPSINNRTKDGMKRNLKLFLKDQSDFQQRVQKKRKEILFRSESEKKVLNLGHPSIDKKSKILAKKINNKENVFERLYKSSKDKNKEDKEQKLIEEIDKKIKQNKPKKNGYSHIKSKINIMHKNQSQINNNKIMPEQNNRKNTKNRSKSPFFMSVKKKLLNVKDLPTNKMLWNKFNKKFDNALNLLNIAYNEELELDEYQYYQLLYNLGMVTYNLDKNEKVENKNDIERNNSEELNPEILYENSLKIEEKKLVKNSINILKLDKNKNKIKLIDIKNFLIFVLDNQLYEFYYQFKRRHSAEEIKNLFPLNKFKKECIPNEIIKKYNEELISKVDKTNPKNTKYYYVSKDNKIIFTLDNLQSIKKDFNILNINYRNYKEKSTDGKLDNLYKYPFKPKIDENSEKIYHQYKDKILLNQNENNVNMKHVDRLLLLDKKRKAENQKIKEELDKISIQGCTFKPKINLSYPKTKKNNINKNKKNKFEELYEKGLKILQSKKDRTKEEVELEKQKNELTFQPSLTKESIPITNFTNDIYNEKEYKFLYDRLLYGRLERMVKENKNDRYELNKELKKFVKDNKEYNYIQNLDYFNFNDSNSFNIHNELTENNNFDNGDTQGDKENLGKNKSENEEKNMNNEERDINNSINELNKKDEIPLLIIDVNIKQGIKKKIYVYEGDTPQLLSEKFARENNLDLDIQNKLQNLIHHHMFKLLTRIDEENQSYSEKSQNAKNKIIN